MTSFKSSLFYLLLILLPKNLLSRFIGRLVSIRWPRPLARVIVRGFAHIFSIDVSEAEKQIDEYGSVQEFFIRRLKPGARKLPDGANLLLSPCDGVMSETGFIKHGQLIQAKGKTYQLRDLVGSQEIANCFEGGYFATIYLSPRDYHRFHMPCDGVIKQTIYIPGALWPVNAWAVRNINNLFCINERIISMLKTEHDKLLAHIAVGATNVGKIKLEYCSIESNLDGKASMIKHDNQIKMNKGQELGRFMFGSTVIILCEQGLIDTFLKPAPAKVKMGEVLAYIKS